MDHKQVWLGRVLIGLVLFSNVQSGISFLVNPDLFLPAYELSGISGEVSLRGFGLLFIMWNVPYAVALIHPVRYRVSLYEATAMQAIALVGESLIRWGIPAANTVLRSSILRFIIFDAIGLMCLLGAIILLHSARRMREQDLVEQS